MICLRILTQYHRQASYPVTILPMQDNNHWHLRTASVEIGCGGSLPSVARIVLTSSGALSGICEHLVPLSQTLCYVWRAIRIRQRALRA